MKIILICAQSNVDDWLILAEQQYKNKINHFASFDILRLKNKRIARENKIVRIKFDSDLILSHLHKDDYIILFDERGLKLTSEKYAEKMQNALNTGKKRLVFIIGGPYGIDDTVKNKSDLTVSLSSFVLNHMVAELVALEQIYRGYTILKNIPYHNE